jgi:hypothetical protein
MKGEYELRLREKGDDILRIQQEMTVVRERHDQSLRQKDTEYQAMLQTFTDRIVILSGHKMDNEELVKNSIQRFDKAMELMEKQHTSLVDSQAHSLIAMEHEMRVKSEKYDKEISEIRSKFTRLERIFTSAIQFIRYSPLQVEFITNHRYILQTIQCDYPHLTFESIPVTSAPLVLPAPLAPAPLAPSPLAPSPAVAPSVAHAKPMIRPKRA